MLTDNAASGTVSLIWNRSLAGTTIQYMSQVANVSLGHFLEKEGTTYCTNNNLIQPNNMMGAVFAAKISFIYTLFVGSRTKIGNNLSRPHKL